MEERCGSFEKHEGCGPRPVCMGLLVLALLLAAISVIFCLSDASMAATTRMVPAPVPTPTPATRKAADASDLPAEAGPAPTAPPAAQGTARRVGVAQAGFYNVAVA